LVYLEKFCKASSRDGTLIHENGADFYTCLFPYDNKDFWISGLRPEIRENLCLGRLALKEEGAGKVRVFAIADVVTQSVLEPLHKWIFK